MEKFYLALLCNIETIGLNKVAILLKRFGGAQAIWQASKDDFLSNGISGEIAVKLIEAREKRNPEQLAAFCQQESINVVTYLDDNYPVQLLNTGRAPLVLFIKGFLTKKDKIAIVGSRKATAYGLSVASQFASDLARADIEVISGGAKGIDCAAHKGALMENKATIAVFGCGLDVCYPREHKRLFEQIVAENGALVSEYLPGTQPKAWHFPARNRIISGLSKGVLVVEANKKSGSLITANFAVEDNREVYCVPGSIYSASSIGVHNLIKQGAKLVDRPEEILEDFGKLFIVSKKKEKVVVHNLNDNEKIILDCLIEGKQFSMDEIVYKTDLPPADISLALLELEVSGYISSSAGIYQGLGRKI